MHGGRVLEQEVVAQQRLGLAIEGGLFVGREPEARVLRVLAEFLLRPLKTAQGGGDGALAGVLAEKELEGSVHQRALGGVRRRGLGQPVDVGELEGERAVLERRHLGGGQRRGQRKSHRFRL